MSDERNNSLRKFALFKNCVTPKSSHLKGSPQTPLGEFSVSNPFTLPIHESLHQPFCSPETYYSAIRPYDSSFEGLKGITEENQIDLDSSPKNRCSVRLINTIWSPEQQALLCPVNIDEKEVARQAKAEANAILTCRCDSGKSKGRACQIHLVEPAHQAKLQQFWGGPLGLQSPASASPPSAQSRRLQALISASARLNIDEDDYVSCSSSCSNRLNIEEVPPPEGCASIACQTDFHLPTHPVTHAELVAAFLLAISSNHMHRTIFDFTEATSDSSANPPAAANYVGIGKINVSPPFLCGQNGSRNISSGIKEGGGDIRRRRSRPSGDDGGLTPRRPPCSIGVTPSLSIKRKSFGDIDLSPINGDSAGSCNSSKLSRKDHSKENSTSVQDDSDEFISLQNTNLGCEDLSSPEIGDHISPISRFGDVMSSTCYTESCKADLEDKTTDNGYQSMALHHN